MITMMHHVILCFLKMFVLSITLCLAPCILLSLTFCRSSMVGRSRGRLQFKKGRMMRTSPRWLHARRLLPEVTSRLQLGRHVRLGFSRYVRTVSAISPTYDVETSHSLMRWNGDNDAVDLVLVLAPEGSWIMLCDHENVLHHLFWAFSGFVSCQAFGPC